MTHTILCVELLNIWLRKFCTDTSLNVKKIVVDSVFLCVDTRDI